MAGLYQRRFIVVEHFRSHFSNLFLYSCHRRQRQSVSRDFQWPCCYERRYPYGKCESFRTYCHAFRQYDMRRTRSRCCLEHQSGNFRYDIFMAGSNIIWCHRRYVGQQPDESQSDPDKQQHGCRYRSIYHIGNHSCRLYECLDYGSHHHGESESCGYGYPSSQAFCGSSATTNIDLTSSLPGTSYTWAVSQAGGVTGSSACASGCGTNISQTLSNAGGTSGTATYTVTPTDGTCTGSTITVVVTLTPTPVGNASNLTPAVCSGTGAGVTLTSSVTGTTYAWAVSQSGVSGATPCASSCGTSINQTLTNGGTSNGTATYTVTPTANGCPGAPLRCSCDCETDTCCHHCPVN